MTQQQQWGLAYLTQIHNESIEQSNTRAEARNSLMHPGEAKIETQALLTVDSFVEMRTSEMADEGYRLLINHKEQTALKLFRSKTPEEQDSLVALLQSPDVLKG